MLVLNRFRGDGRDPSEVRAGLQDALSVLAEQTGFVEGHVGRNVDDTDLWVLQTRWEGPGAYRRALSAYDVKLRGWPHLVHALDEPSAYEVLGPGDRGNEARSRVTR
jgi:hypothetical protein